MNLNQRLLTSHVQPTVNYPPPFGQFRQLVSDAQNTDLPYEKRNQHLTNLKSLILNQPSRSVLKPLYRDASVLLEGLLFDRF